MRAPRGIKTVSVVNSVPITTYRWRVNGTIRGYNGSTLNIIHSWCIPGTNTVNVESYRCGNWVSSETYQFEAEFCDVENGRISSFVVSPNPVGSTLNILPNPSFNNKNSMQEIKEIIVTNKQGQTVYQQKFTNGQKQISIPFGHNKFDLYYVKIWNGEEWATLKFRND